MVLFLKVFESKNASVHEEALMAVGAIANGIVSVIFSWKISHCLTMYCFVKLLIAISYGICPTFINGWNLLCEIGRSIWSVGWLLAL